MILRLIRFLPISLLATGTLQAAAESTRNGGSEDPPGVKIAVLPLKEIDAPRFSQLPAGGTGLDQAQPIVDEEDLALAYGDKSFVSIATGSRQLVKKAPSAATVITAEEIASMGARTLSEALEAVPGLHIREPSKIASGITYDLPMLGRTLWLQARYSL